MSICLQNVITDIELNDDQRKKIETFWTDFFQRMRPSDDTWILEQVLENIESKIKAVLDDTMRGRRYFGQTACAIYIQRKDLPEEILSMATFNKKGLELFVELVKKVSADARQAFNDYLGELGVQGN